jgi:hypothetical protein
MRPPEKSIVSWERKFDSAFDPPDELDDPGDPEDAGGLPEHDPDWHIPPVAVQSTHACAPLPHALSSAPLWQLPDVSQQPLAHVVVHDPPLPPSSEAPASPASSAPAWFQCSHDPALPHPTPHAPPIRHVAAIMAQLRANAREAKHLDSTSTLETYALEAAAAGAKVD